LENFRLYEEKEASIHIKKTNPSEVIRSSYKLTNSREKTGKKMHQNPRTPKERKDTNQECHKNTPHDYKKCNE